MKVKSPTELPETYGCKKCGQTKPVAEMLVVQRKREGDYYLRPRCKTCHNAFEAGHRREYKRKYLQRWRRKNADLARSYWDNPEVKQQITKRANRYWQENREAKLIQGRLQRHGVPCTIAEAREYLKQYGPNYPTAHGLTPTGLKVVEQIRSRLKNSGQYKPVFEIRLMVYEDSDEHLNYVITPSNQKFFYKHSSKRLRAWQQQQRDRKERDDRRSL